MRSSEFGCDQAPAVLTAVGDLVLALDETAERLHELLGSGVRCIVLDLTDAAYVSGAGLGLIAEAAKQARHHGGDVKLVVRRPEVRRVFELGGLGSLLEFYEDTESACAAFSMCVGEAERTLLWRQFSYA